MNGETSEVPAILIPPGLKSEFGSSCGFDERKSGAAGIYSVDK
jgi:hypothetical protein